MNIRAVYPATFQQAQADAGDIAALQQKLLEHSDALSAMAADVGMAKTVREFSGDQRKRCLAIAALPLLKAGASAAAADMEARGEAQYGAALKQLENDLANAETVIAQHEARKIAWESVRSVLSCHKESIRQL